MKKILVISIFSLLLVFNLKLTPLFAESLGYQEISEKKNQNLLEDLTWRNVSAQSKNDLNRESIQDVHVVKNNSSHVQMVNWSYFNTAGKLSAQSVLTIAKDFENKNPGYKVLSGINGDYFTTGSTINANVTFGGNLIKSGNHSKYSSVYFSENGKYQNNVKTNRVSILDYLTIYNEDGSIYDIRPINSFNNNAIRENETTVFYSSSKVSQNEAFKFKVNALAESSVIGSEIYLKGKIEQKIDSFTGVSTSEMVIATRDQSLAEKLASNPVVRVQKMFTNEKLFYNNMIGVGSTILKNSVIPSFEEIADQNLSFTKERHPRTSFGFTEQGEMVLLTVDGRQTGFSQGVDLRELGNIMKYYGCTDAYNLDGGGSTTMVVREENQLKIVNSVSDGSVRPVYNALLFVVPDISVNFTLSNYRRSSLDLTYQIDNMNALEIIEQKIVYNGKEKILPDLKGLAVLNDLRPYNLNSFNLVLKYKKDGRIYSRSFAQKVIHLGKGYGLYSPIEPNDFKISFAEDPENSGFIAHITFKDPSEEIKSLALYDENNLAYTNGCAVPGGWKIQINQADNNRNYQFKIGYIKYFDSALIKLEETFHYTYQGIKENQGNSNCQPKEAGNKTIIISLLSVLGLTSLAVYLLRRK